jgi:hypothetical protein
MFTLGLGILLELNLEILLSIKLLKWQDEIKKLKLESQKF